MFLITNVFSKIKEPVNLYFNIIQTDRPCGFHNYPVIYGIFIQLAEKNLQFTPSLCILIPITLRHLGHLPSYAVSSLFE